MQDLADDASFAGCMVFSGSLMVAVEQTTDRSIDRVVQLCRARAYKHFSFDWNEVSKQSMLAR